MAEADELSEKEKNTSSRRFIQRNSLAKPDYTWGFPIFRTIYTPESDENWDPIIARIKGYVAFASADMRHDNSLDPGPNQIIVTKFKNKVFQDKEKLEGASFEIIRKNFWEWDEVRPKQTTELLLLKACDPKEWSKMSAFVKLIDTCWDIVDSERSNESDEEDLEAGGMAEDNAGYQGWVKAEAKMLWNAYSMLRHVNLDSRWDQREDGSLYYA
ncbi:hypothetical protein BKA64DRAFT_752565 [Cadophora sp. MPI-SDFR-AT-0126]|nr:hypothetical protein BKA64DRAFT_752565 [Leotiomycetes sp. MPI-SDFR-AT-0126]